MPIKKLVVPLVELAMVVTSLRNSKQDYDRFMVSIFPRDRRFVEVRAWKYKARPYQRKQAESKGPPSDSDAV